MGNLEECLQEQREWRFWGKGCRDVEHGVDVKMEMDNNLGSYIILMV